MCTVGGHLRPRRRSPRNPFTGLAASKISCMNCGYTVSVDDGMVCDSYTKSHHRPLLDTIRLITFHYLHLRQ